MEEVLSHNLDLNAFTFKTFVGTGYKESMIRCYEGDLWSSSATVMIGRPGDASGSPAPLA